MWVPSHTGIKGNEEADQAAKESLKEVISYQYENTCRDRYKLLINLIREQWQHEWITSTTELTKTKKTIAEWKTSNQANSTFEVALARLRIGHTRITHDWILSRTPQPGCTTCQKLLTVEHIIAECPIYQQERNLAGIKGNLEDILQNNTQTIKKLLGFLTKTELIKNI